MTEGTDKNQIEKVARAICSANGCDPDTNHEGSPIWVDWVDDAKAAIAAMPVQAEPVAWRYERTDGFVILVSKRYTDQHPKGDGWTEQALGVIPTPPNGGSDAE